MFRPLLLFAAWGVMGIAPATATTLLAVDIDDRTALDSPTNTVAGYESFTIDTSGTAAVASATRTLASGYTITMTAIDDGNPSDGGAAGNQPAALDDRDRVAPSGLPTGTQPDAGSPTLNQLYDDLIFVTGAAGPAGGLDLAISGGALQPNQSYVVSIYSYDAISATGGSDNPTRAANWFDGNSLDALMFTAIFNTKIRPTTDDMYKFTASFMTDAAGTLLLKGRRVTSADVAVYLNGFEVATHGGDAVPEPTSLYLAGLALPAALLAVRRRRLANQ